MMLYSLSYIQQALVHEENKFSGSTVLTGGPGGSALLTKQPRQIRCYGCEEVGHIRRYCSQKKVAHNASTARENMVVKEREHLQHLWSFLLELCGL